MAESRLERWLEPRRALPVLLVVVLIVLLFSPSGWIGQGAGTLTTFGGGPGAARSIYLVLQRLGWTVERRRTPLRAPLDTTVTYVILAPPIEPSATEVSALLDAVRRGATAIVTPDPDTPLSDSTGIRRQYLFAAYPAHADAEPVDASVAAIQHAAENLEGFVSALAPVPQSEADTSPRFPTGIDTLVMIGMGETAHPEIMEEAFGRGRLIALADPNFLRNRYVNDTAGAILGVRVIERAQRDEKRIVVFDEYHQGYGEDGGPGSVLRDAFVGTAAGRVALMLFAALAVWYLATGIRPIAPVAMRPIERRSPLEHVGALSRAYEQVRATRTVAARLVRGLRRRHPVGATGASSDDAYLDLLAARTPAVQPDVRTLRHALQSQLSAAELVAVGGAIDHIERTVSQ